MSYRYDDEKKRPPPLNLPYLPPPRPLPGRDIQEQQQQRNATNSSNSTRQGQRTSGTTPLTSPVEPETRFPPSSSGRSRKAMSTFTNILASPRKSDHGSASNSYRGSTARSRQSERSQHSAAAAQAQLEELDEKTTRGKIEARSERNLFKMTGQVPPTPITGSHNENDVVIRTEDLRSQCRAASGEKQSDLEDPAKSPKKKLFSSIRNPFNKTSNPPAPPMPSKAAQVFGTTGRQPHVMKVRPVRPAQPFEQTSMKVSRSDTAKSLPAKVAHPDDYTRRHRSGSSRRNRTSGRRSPGRGSPNRQSSDIENTPPMPRKSAVFELAIPPTPPAKDTPPDQRVASPLRRIAPTHDLRESYDTYKDSTKMRFPDFALSPLPPMGILPTSGGASPTKFRPYTAEDYTKLIGGEPLQWPYPERSDSLSKTEGGRDATMIGANLDAPYLRRPDRQSEKHENSNRVSDQFSPLHPRFYSPTHLSARGFAEGETPSKNSDTSRLLFTVPSKSLTHLRDDSNNGSIEMVYQGDARDIDPNSPTGKEVSRAQQQSKSKQKYTDLDLSNRLKQELRIGEHSESRDQQRDSSGHFQPDESSSRLTDMLMTGTSGRSDSHGGFYPHCLSAVPSPLHRTSGPLVSARSIVPSNGSVGAFAPQTPRSIDDHFFMTNEHLDVVGKTTWDLLEKMRVQQAAHFKTYEKKMMEVAERHFKDTQSKMTSLHEKVDCFSDNQQKLLGIVDELVELVKKDGDEALAEKEKKGTNVDAQLKELKQMIQDLQKSSEDKVAEPKHVQQQVVTGQVNTPNTSHSQFLPPSQRSETSIASYYASAEAGRESQQTVHANDNRGMASSQEGPNDLRGGHPNGHGVQWSGRPGYAGRNSKEDRMPYPGTTNPYHYATNGQYHNGYAGGYSPYAFSPNAPEQQYPFIQGQTK